MGALGLAENARLIRPREQLLADYETAAESFRQQVDERTPDEGIPTVIETADGPAVSVTVTMAIAQAANTPAGSVYLALGAEVGRRAAVYSDHPDYQPEWAVDD
jgi:hypothetical protein